MLSGGEQRTLAAAQSLLGSEPVDLSEAMTGPDRPAGHAVIAALTHATGASNPIRTRTLSRDAGQSITPLRDEGTARNLG